MKLTKKANTYIFNQVLKINPKASKNTTYDQAYEILMDAWNLYGSVETCKKGITKFKLYRNDEVIKVYEWSNIYIEGSWDFDIIFRTVLEDIIKNKLFKEKKKRSLKK